VAAVVVDMVAVEILQQLVAAVVLVTVVIIVVLMLRVSPQLQILVVEAVVQQEVPTQVELVDLGSLYLDILMNTHHHIVADVQYLSHPLEVI
jgi:hypothetical protein